MPNFNALWIPAPVPFLIRDRRWNDNLEFLPFVVGGPLEALNWKNILTETDNRPSTLSGFLCQIHIGIDGYRMLYFR